MRIGETYEPLFNIPGFTVVEEDVTLVPGKSYLAVTFDKMLDVGSESDTKQLIEVSRFHASNVDWFFRNVNEFNPQSKVQPTIRELAESVVRCVDGSMLAELYELVTNPCPRDTFTIETFSSALSASPRIEMRHEGKVVKGLKHNKHFCTYHCKKTK